MEAIDGQNKKKFTKLKIKVDVFLGGLSRRSPQSLESDVVGERRDYFL